MPHLTRALLIGFVITAAACNRDAISDSKPTASNAVPPASAPAEPAPAVAASEPPAPTTGTRDTVVPGTRSTIAWREVTIPAGTTLPVVLDTTVASDSSRVEDPVRAHLSRAVMVDGVAAVPQGSVISGVVTASERPGKVKGTGHVAVRFDTLVSEASDERYRIHTAAVGRAAPTQKKKDAVEIGAPAAGGAIIGGLIGGKKGAVIGGAAGGGAGTAVVMNQRGKDARLGKGTVLTLRLTEPLTVRIRA